MDKQSANETRHEETAATEQLGTVQHVPAAVTPIPGERAGTMEPDRAESLHGESLDQLAEGIVADHEAAERAAQTTLELILRAGLRLLEAKKRHQHGGFTRWVKQHLPFSHRTANRYMRIANDWPKLEAIIATRGDFAVREVERLLSPRQLAAPEPKTIVESEALFLREEELTTDKSSELLLAAIERLLPGQGLLADHEIRLNGSEFEKKSALVSFLGPGLGYQLYVIAFNHDLNRGSVHRLQPQQALEAFTMLEYFGFRNGEFELVEEIQPHLDEFHGILKRCEPEKGSADSARLEILQEYREILTRGDARSPADAARLKHLEDQLRQVNQRIREGAA